MASSELCKICGEQPFKYTCPRCNINYCSLTCYRTPEHQQCSEAFYKESVIQELSQQQSAEDSPSSVKQMHEILKRLDKDNEFDNDNFDLDDEGDEDLIEEELDSDDESDVPELSERLKEIDLNNTDALWDCLTQDERQEFKSMIQSGDVTKLLPAIEPWWEYKLPTILVQEVDSKDEENKSKIVLEKSPKIIAKIKQFQTISSKPPAPCVQSNLVNVVAAYTFVYRYFNGDHHSYSREAVSSLIAISANLKSNANYDSESLAIESVSHECRIAGMMADEETTITMKNDILCMITGPGGKHKKSFYLLSALSDIHKLLNTAKHCVNPVEPQPSNSSNFTKYFQDRDVEQQAQYLQKSTLNSCIRKIEYYLSFVSSYF